jgi:hypothetical protein
MYVISCWTSRRYKVGTVNLNRVTKLLFARIGGSVTFFPQVLSVLRSREMEASAAEMRGCKNTVSVV